ncbi:hypothetical protein E5288_WYG003751 [Bos mutus]|uniref:Uncharacterized protein n=1 Tax=Bos mutus TaxID=72004 RepID=A0A6B0RKX8_9CETA|nr:hypothetical protein [Bos mutus]
MYIPSSFPFTRPGHIILKQNVSNPDHGIIPRTLTCIVNLILLIKIFMHSREHIRSESKDQWLAGLSASEQLRSRVSDTGYVSNSNRKGA